MNWTTGTIAGTLNNTGVLAISGAANKIVGGTINETGATTWKDAGNLTFNDGTAFNSLAGSVFDVQTDARTRVPAVAGCRCSPTRGRSGSRPAPRRPRGRRPQQQRDGGPPGWGRCAGRGRNDGGRFGGHGLGRLRVPSGTMSVNAAMSASNLVLEGGTLTGGGT